MYQLLDGLSAANGISDIYANCVARLAKLQLLSSLGVANVTVTKDESQGLSSRVPVSLANWPSGNTGGAKRGVQVV